MKAGSSVEAMLVIAGEKDLAMTQWCNKSERRQQINMCVYQGVTNAGAIPLRLAMNTLGTQESAHSRRPGEITEDSEMVILTAWDQQVCIDCAKYGPCLQTGGP